MGRMVRGLKTSWSASWSGPCFLVWEFFGCSTPGCGFGLLASISQYPSWRHECSHLFLLFRSWCMQLRWVHPVPGRFILALLRLGHTRGCCNSVFSITEATSWRGVSSSVGNIEWSDHFHSGTILPQATRFLTFFGRWARWALSLTTDEKSRVPSSTWGWTHRGRKTMLVLAYSGIVLSKVWVDLLRGGRSFHLGGPCRCTLSLSHSYSPDPLLRIRRACEDKKAWL